ncbi:hypothetical protein KQX54_001654 [Cotesia glomerata]|uniref:Uncharacterized protein n=1 Tax=Cotesia glomerata TaxID=32391 RepID=A0AAV7HWH1_COTGL|nr:hypothetical protein KQX54_001654 [Cotesia glomerata]
MGNLITYSYIMPRTWVENYTEAELIPIIWEQVHPYLMESNNWMFGPIITVAGVTTILNVLNLRFCWWFAIPGDRVPSEDQYYFSQNFINIDFWAQREIVLNVLDDDWDADILILDDFGVVNQNYVRDQNEAARLQEVNLRQIQLLRRNQNPPGPKDDVGLELDALYEEDEPFGVSTCEDPDLKMMELNREIFSLKKVNSELKWKANETNSLKNKIEELNMERSRLEISNTYQQQRIADLEKRLEVLMNELSVRTSGCESATVQAGPSTSYEVQCPYEVQQETTNRVGPGWVPVKPFGKVWIGPINDSNDDNDDEDEDL